MTITLDGGECDDEGYDDDRGGVCVGGWWWRRRDEVCKIDDAATSYKRGTRSYFSNFQFCRPVLPSFFISLSSVILFPAFVFFQLILSLPSLSRFLSLIPGAGPSPIHFHSSFRNYFIVVVDRYFPKCALEFSDSSDIELQNDESTL